jgi:four helix bundle protein
MGTIHSFEDMDIWKKAQELGALVYDLCDKNKAVARDFSFKDQVKRAALSVSNNIAEGFEYSNNNDFHRFLRIAKGSCGEVRNCLLFAIKVKYCTEAELKELVTFCRTLSSQIGNMMQYLKKYKLQQQSSANKPVIKLAKNSP